MTRRACIRQLHRRFALPPSGVEVFLHEQWASVLARPHTLLQFSPIARMSWLLEFGAWGVMRTENLGCVSPLQCFRDAGTFDYLLRSAELNFTVFNGSRTIRLPENMEVLANARDKQDSVPAVKRRMLRAKGSKEHKYRK